MRVDNLSLISGAMVCGDRGLGVLGSTILADTATGDHGAGYLYNDVDPGDEGKEFRGLIVTPPSAGTFFAYEDGSFSLVAPDGAYTFVYKLYVDGVDLGNATASVTIGGAATASASLNLTLDSAMFSGTASSTTSGVSASLAVTLNDSVFAGAASVSPVASLNVVLGNAVFSGTAYGVAPLGLPSGAVTFTANTPIYSFTPDTKQFTFGAMQ